MRLDSAEPGRFPLAAGLPVATGQFGLAQTENRKGGRGEEEERGKPALLSYRGNRKKKQMTWRSGRGR